MTDLCSKLCAVWARSASWAFTAHITIIFRYIACLIRHCHFIGQAPVLNYIDHLIELVKTEKVVLDDIITHTLPLSEVTHGYEIFNKKEEDCVKVVLKPWEQRKETENEEPVKIEN